MPMHPHGERLHSGLFSCVIGTVLQSVGEEPELGSSTQGTAEPHSSAASVSAKASQPTSLQHSQQHFPQCCRSLHGCTAQACLHKEKKKKIIFKQRIWTRNAAHESLRKGLEDSWWHILGDVTSDLGQGDPRAPVPRPRSCGWIGNRWWVVVGPKHPPLQASSVPSGPASSAQRKQLKNLVCHKAA